MQFWFRKVEVPRSVTFESLEELRSFVEHFENCTLPPHAWDHATHLTLAVWFLVNHDECQATDRFVAALRRYHRAHGHRLPRQAAYHETLTLFWLAVARRYLRQERGFISVLGLVNGFLTEYGDREDLPYEHYRKATLRSPEASYSWVAPDLQPLV